MSLAAVAASALVAWTPTPAAPILVDGRPISRGHLRHWADIAQELMPERQAAREEAARLLVNYRWLREEAIDRGVMVTRAQVERSFRRQRREAFRTGRAYRRWLRRSGQTEGDVLLRVRSELLADRLRELAVAGATEPDEQQARLDAFAVEFRRKWTALTVCSPPWVIEDCGAVVAPR